MEQAENDAYLSTLNDLKPTAPFDFGEQAEIKVRNRPCLLTLKFV